MTSTLGFRISGRTPGGEAAFAVLLATLLALLAAGGLGCATRLAPPPQEGVGPAYRVGAPDELTIEILPEPELELERTVRPDGMISVPLIGDVRAGGRTVEEIASDIEERISRYKRGAQVSVALVAAASTDITVLGEVKNPSAFPLVKATRAAEAIGEVGGTNQFARDSRIRVIRSVRGETAVMRVNLKAIRGGDLSSNILLEPGDIVYVPPTILARIGYALQAVLFPFSPLLGVAQAAGGNLLVP